MSIDSIPEQPDSLPLSLVEAHDTTQQLLFVAADKAHTLPTQKNISAYISAYHQASAALYDIVLHYLCDNTISLVDRAHIVAVLLRNDEQNRVAFYNGLYPDRFINSDSIQDIETLTESILEQLETIQIEDAEEPAQAIAGAILAEYDEFANIDLEAFIAEILSSKKALALRVGKKGLELAAVAVVAGIGAYSGARLANK